MNALLLNYNEIALKGDNRGAFERKLVDNVRLLPCAHFFRRVERISGRILVTLADDAFDHRDEIESSLALLYGVSRYLWTEQVPLTMEKIETAVSAFVAEKKFATFAVRSRRANKEIPFSSDEMNRTIGALVQKNSGAGVDLENPEITFYIEMVEQFAYLGCAWGAGPGGLPVGVSGKVMVLLSGGIDSPVAAGLLQKRGCVVEGIHFHNAPYTSYASVEKVKEIAKKLAGPQQSFTLHLVPFTETQKQIVKACDQKYRVLLYRRFMLRVGEALARRRLIHGLATGESIGQVASQTIENIESVSSVATMPIYRPVIGFDKEEIVQAARRIGTYDTSILPHEDCCTYFMPRKPATKSRSEDLDREEANLDVTALVAETLEKIETVIL